MSFPTISEIVPGSPAAQAGAAVGDELVAIDGVVPSDVIEYQQLVDEEQILLTLRRGGLEWEVTIDKAAGAPLGLRLDSSVFDRVQTCDNHCEFCFIYQLPPGLRKSLYLKDDDYRLSFLYGNFTTLTRFTELDFARVVHEKLSPIYVSIHATDPTVRAEMLRNRRGATSLRWLRGLLDAGIEVHGQIVLCPGINGGDVLDRTCAEILVRYPRLASVGIVPLGLSRYNRENNLRAHTSGEAAAVIDQVQRWQAAALEGLGRRMFFAADEFYVLGGCPVPGSEDYEGFVQHENGIGMARAFYDELEAAEGGRSLDPLASTGRWLGVEAAPPEGYRAVRSDGDNEHPPAAGPVGLVTGEYGAVVLGAVMERLARLAEAALQLVVVENDFFGGNVAVAGLMAGQDVVKAIRADRSHDRYLLPDVAVSGDRFLDDLTVDEVVAQTGADVRVVPTSVAGLIAGARS
jgi:putative radical SAM enzyme (TIGR03279 family)